MGFTTDGEFNLLRTKGKTRPISVVEIMIVKKEAKSINVNTLTKMFTIDERGMVVRNIHSHAILLSSSVDQWFWTVN